MYNNHGATRDRNFCLILPSLSAFHMILWIMEITHCQRKKAKPDPQARAQSEMNGEIHGEVIYLSLGNAARAGDMQAGRTLRECGQGQLFEATRKSTRGLGEQCRFIVRKGLWLSDLVTQSFIPRSCLLLIVIDCIDIKDLSFAPGCMPRLVE